METIQANFLDQLQKMGSKYYKVLPVNLDPISSKKVKCHQKNKNVDKKLVTLSKYIESVAASTL